MSNIKSLVTGGAGFIGSHLCEALLERGDEVFCLDNFITGSLKNIDHLRSNPLFHLIEWDIIKPLGQISNLSHIYHLASPASPVQYQKYPIETLLVNSVGTYNLLELARKIGAKFLYASSSEIYGEPLEHPQKETYWGNVNPIGPRSCYDEGKRFGEAITSAFIRKWKVDARIIRIFNTYGPRMQKDDGRVVSNFIIQALTGSPITVYGKGLQTRSFCFVTDLVSGLIKAMESGKTRSEVINLGNPDEKKVIEIANVVKNLTNSSSEIIFKNLPQDDPSRRCPDIIKTQRLLNWFPQVTLEDGLKRTIEYFRSV